jgi:hypothetical protein
VAPQPGNDVADTLLGKLGQLTLLAQSHIDGIVVEHVFTDDPDHRLRLMGLDNPCQPVAQLFYSFSKFHDGAKLQNLPQTTLPETAKNGKFGNDSIPETVNYCDLRRFFRNFIMICHYF